MAEDTEREEKTEEATPRHLDEARERGQVALSSELLAAAGLGAAAIAFTLGGSALGRAGGSLIATGAEEAGRLGSGELTRAAAVASITGAVRATLPSFLLIVLPVVAFIAIVGYAQAGVRVAPRAVSFDPSRLHPMQGLKRMFSARSAARTGLSVAKLVALAAAVAAVAWTSLPRIASLAGDDLGPALATAGSVLARAGLAAIVALIAIAIFDLWFQRLQFARDMRMSKKEVREEHKATEGDPLVRSRIRSIQREVARRRMMADVPRATVVVTNPTHFAVALRYEPERSDAPRVVAKGVDAVAETIKRVAREAGVIVFEDAPLARGLHRACDVGDEVPSDLFGAVAGVLAYVYRIQGGMASARGGRA